jgi:hypothetical protein
MIFVKTDQDIFPVLPSRGKDRKLMVPLAGSTVEQDHASVSSQHCEIVLGALRLGRIG